MSGLSAWAYKMGGNSVAAGDAMNKAVKILWHDVTTYSYSTLTDTYNGGVKTDLSTAFELPYTMFRGVEMYPGQKDSAVTSDIKLRKQSWFHGSPNISTNASGLAVDLDYNRPNLVDKLGSENELLLASPRASEWAPRYLKPLLGSSYSTLVTRNGTETPSALASSTRHRFVPPSSTPTASSLRRSSARMPPARTPTASRRCLGPNSA